MTPWPRGPAAGHRRTRRVPAVLAGGLHHRRGLHRGRRHVAQDAV